MAEKTILASFIYLRWFSFLGQSIVLALAVFAFQLTIPWMIISAVIIMIPATNLLAATNLTSGIEERKICGCLLTIDTLLLTGVLYFAGGPTNPFTIVYLLHVVLSAVILNPAWTWSIALLTAACFSFLFISSRSIPEWEHHGAHHGFSLHLHGMLFAYITVCILVAYFLNLILNRLREKEMRLQQLQSIAQNQQRLATLTALSAGAAHELNTPLGTITLVAHELERNLSIRKDSNPDQLEDIRLLKSEALRCKEILNDLSRQSGEPFGETHGDSTIKDLIDSALLPLSAYGVNFKLNGELNKKLISIPLKAFILSLRSLVKNSVEASLSNDKPEVEIKVDDCNNQVLIEINDSGPGIDQGQMKRIGEPFFSTKENGMGLGVYLAKLTIEQMGGSLSYRSNKNGGTSSIVRLSA